MEQVRELRGSPARMLFVLNRIDEFLRDFDGGSQARTFVAETTATIRDAVAAALPEYEEVARQITPLPLSTLRPCMPTRR